MSVYLREGVSSGQRKFSDCKFAQVCPEIHQPLVHFHRACVCYFYWGLLKTCVKCSFAEVMTSVLLCFTRPCNLFKDEHLDRLKPCRAMLICLLLKNAPHACEITLKKGRRRDLQLALFSRGHFKSNSPDVLRTSLPYCGFTTQSHRLSPLQLYLFPLSLFQCKQHNIQLELSAAICIIYSFFHPKSRNTQVRVKAVDCMPSKNWEDPTVC